MTPSVGIPTANRSQPPILYTCLAIRLQLTAPVAPSVHLVLGMGSVIAIMELYSADHAQIASG